MAEPPVGRKACLRARRGRTCARGTVFPWNSLPTRDFWESMMSRKAALAVMTLIGSLAGGLALGSYAVGGLGGTVPQIFKGEAGAEHDVAAWIPPPPPPPATIGPVSARHVCTGCDADLYREADWRQSASYDDADLEDGYRFVDADGAAVPSTADDASAPSPLEQYGLTLPLVGTPPVVTVARAEP